MSSSYSEFKPRADTPAQRIRQNKEGVRRAERQQRLQQWLTMGFIALCLAVGGYLLISSEIQTRTPSQQIADAAADAATTEPALPPGENMPASKEGSRTKASETSLATAETDEASETVTVDLRDEPAEKAVDPAKQQAVQDRMAEESSLAAPAEKSAAVSQTAEPEQAAMPSKQAEPEPASAKQQPPAPSAKVASARFTYGMTGGQPGPGVDYIQSSAIRDGIIYFHSVVEGKPGAGIVHEWRQNGRVVEAQRFRLTGSRDVFVSSHSIDPQAFGTYRVYVRDANGEAISVGSALYEPN